VGNLETTFSGARQAFSGYPAFNTPDELAAALSGLGVHVVSLANNHILDRGYQGIRRTTEVLDRAGILWTGISDRDTAPGIPLALDFGGLRWAFVNFTYGVKRGPSGVNAGGIPCRYGESAMKIWQQNKLPGIYCQAKIPGKEKNWPQEGRRGIRECSRGP
jgi:hypothetical protein